MRDQITLPPLEPAFARTLLNAARRDAEAFVKAYHANPEQKRFWIETSAQIRDLIAGLPAEPAPAAASDSLEDLLG